MTNKTRVLIVEDDIDISQLLTLRLDRLGYEIVAVVDNGIDAIREGGAKLPDIVLMDIMLKGQMDGIETAKVLQRDYGLPVIYLTSFADDATIEKVEQSGAQGYVLKPVQEREVHAMIKLALNRHRRSGEISRTLRTAERVTEQLRQSIGEVALKVGGRDERSLRDELWSALDAGQFEVHYQPRAALNSGEIAGVEALLRWNHPRHGTLLPERFLPIAEEAGFIATIDEWVLREAVAAAKVWRVARPALRVTVNVSPVSMRRDALLARMNRILANLGYDPAGLELDITESILVHHTDHEMGMLKDLKSSGIRLAVDNFGVGYAAVSNLQHLPFDIVKIDRSFVHKAATGRNASAVIQAIIQLADAMGLATVAEGVETRDELLLLAEHGCHDIQGFLFSAPVPAAQIQDLLARDTRLELPPTAQGRLLAHTSTVIAEPDPVTDQQQALIEELVATRTQALREANAELEAFSYSVSHDLRVPLRAIIGFTAMLGDTARDKLDAEEARILDSVQRAGKRMSQQIDALLALSRLSHTQRLTETIDLSELAHSVLRNLELQYPSARIEAEIQPGLEVRGDPGMMRSVIENLLGNALKFSSGKPVARIRVSLAQTQHGEAFCIADEGAGFDMARADRLFGVFQRLHTEREYPGTGVGLASVKRIIARHGGKVWAESEFGNGAKFYFTVPADASTQA
ncbi:MAG: EAL domain-containing protein [Burkholderiales bacterium]|nr:EAL domain-containing protein [Burkholderiales bacterium]